MEVRGADTSDIQTRAQSATAQSGGQKTPNRGGAPRGSRPTTLERAAWARIARESGIPDAAILQALTGKPQVPAGAATREQRRAVKRALNRVIRPEVLPPGGLAPKDEKVLQHAAYQLRRYRTASRLLAAARERVCAPANITIVGRMGENLKTQRVLATCDPDGTLQWLEAELAALEEWTSAVLADEAADLRQVPRLVSLEDTLADVDRRADAVRQLRDEIARKHPDAAEHVAAKQRATVACRTCGEAMQHSSKSGLCGFCEAEIP
jgi:hypothetical protein